MAYNVKRILHVSNFDMVNEDIEHKIIDKSEDCPFRVASAFHTSGNYLMCNITELVCTEEDCVNSESCPLPPYDG